jgi:hypothetical protein
VSCGKVYTVVSASLIATKMNEEASREDICVYVYTARKTLRFRKYEILPKTKN